MTQLQPQGTTWLYSQFQDPKTQLCCSNNFATHNWGDIAYNITHSSQNPASAMKDDAHMSTTPIISIRVCGTNSWNMHYFAKSQNEWGVEFFKSDTKLMNACLLIIHFRTISACSKVLVEWYKNIICTCLSMNNARMNSADIFSGQCYYE